jgi:hypothetical protein
VPLFRRSNYTLNIEAAISSEMFANSWRTIRCHIAEGSYLHKGQSFPSKDTVLSFKKLRS